MKMFPFFIMGLAPTSTWPMHLAQEKRPQETQSEKNVRKISREGGEGCNKTM